MRNHARAAFGLATALLCVAAGWAFEEPRTSSSAPGEPARSRALRAAGPPIRSGVGVVAGPGGLVERPRIAYAVTMADGTTDIATMRADGSSRFLVVHNPANDTEPVWSPGGQVITFVSDRTGTPDIYTVDANGANLQQMTFGESASHPRWSPRGEGIAYISDAGSLRVVDATSLDVRRVVSGQVSGFTWSPDGTRIAYRTGPAGARSGGVHGIHVVDSDGANPVELDRIGPAYFPNMAAASTPIWEGGSTFVRYGRLTGFGDGGIDRARGRRVSVQGLSREVGSSGGAPLAMSPDGSRMVGSTPTAEPPFPGYLRVVDVATGESALIDRVNWTSIEGSRFDWSPDGSQVAYGDRGRIFVVDAATASSVEVVSSHGSHPSWRRQDSRPPEVPPSATRVLPNYPNPFADATSLPYDLREAADVSVDIFAFDGSLVRAIAVRQREPGRYVELWDGRNDEGEPVASGVYVWRLQAGSQQRTGRLTVARR